MHGPPQKPWYRPRNVILTLLALFLAWIGREVYIALTAVPGRSIDYSARMNEIIEANQPPGIPRDAPDAWPVLRDIIERQTAVEERLWPPAMRKSGGEVPLDFTVIGA